MSLSLNRFWRLCCLGLIWLSALVSDGAARMIRVGIFQPKHPALQRVMEVPEKDYIIATVQSEMPPNWPLEALKAQAVVDRTFVRRNLGRHKKEGFDFCNLAHCQVYRMLKRVSPRVIEAVRSTDGEILTYDGRPIEALFHSCCGGMTASSEAIWSGHTEPYLIAQPDAEGNRVFCAASPDFRWAIDLSREDLLHILQPSALLGENLKGENVFVVRHDASGRAVEICANVSSGSSCLPAYAFYLAWGRARGWHQLKSTYFEMSCAEDKCRFKGHGLGHGVGLCQWGARGRAESGQSYRAILAHYFPGAQLSSVQ